MVNEDGTVAMAQIRFDQAGGALDPEVTDEVQRLGDELTPQGVEINYSAEITTEDLAAWNQATDVDKEDPADVAQAWLEEKGLL